MMVSLHLSQAGTADLKAVIQTEEALQACRCCATMMMECSSEECQIALVSEQYNQRQCARYLLDPVTFVHRGSIVNRLSHSNEKDREMSCHLLAYVHSVLIQELTDICPVTSHPDVDQFP